MNFKLLFFFLLLFHFFSFNYLEIGLDDSDCYSYIADPQKQEIKLFWKTKKGEIIKTFDNLKKHLANKKENLVFAMNGGMFMQDYSPLGLFIENFKTKKSINRASGKGNFYLKPNGVFYIDSTGRAGVCTTEDFLELKSIQYATQSGPMLVINGKIHPKFDKGSQNLFIRNGVGIMPDGKVLFAISKTEVSFYYFANYFKQKGCDNALYLDGFVSRMYLPSQNLMQMDGEFGVMIAITEKNK